MAVQVEAKQFDCTKCTPAMQAENGCEEDSPIPERWELDGETYQRCPVKLVTGQTWLAIRLYGQYKLGFLPVVGAVLDQSALFLQAIEIIQAEIAKWEKHTKSQ